MKVNDAKGIDYQDTGELVKAENADLITLPQKVAGTNCANCKFMKPIDAKVGLGFCAHPDVQLPVTSRMCCKFWDADGSKRSWEK